LRGFILNTTLVKEEDLVVTILTKNKILRLYRFYGARHSTINVGFLIDFEEEETTVQINRLRNVMQIGFEFLLDINKMMIWQNFIKLFNEHFFEVEEIDSFYFDLLMDILNNFDRNPKRVLVENYIKLLEFEGRLHNEFECFLCEKPINNRVNLARGYLTACEECIPKKGFEIEKIKTLFNEKKTLLLDEKEIESLYKILMLGI
jgi:recombinational DNA repair protein (RecF pathway)